MLLQAFAAIGVVYVSFKIILPVLSWLTRGGVPPTKYGSWAIVTGATDGIGKALCQEFAKAGMNILLISRTQSKLDSVADELEQNFSNIKTKTFAVDYSCVSDTEVSNLKAALKEVAEQDEGIGILVNNVGMSYPYPQYFHELTDEQVNNLISLNVTSTTLMTRLVLPHFLSKESNSCRGAVLNIGSFAGLFPSPCLAEYSASKAYVEKLSASLATEYKDKGISFQCHVPLYVVSKLSKFKREAFNIPSAETYASEVIKTIGNGQDLVSAHMSHNFFTSLIQFIPSGVFRNQVLKMHLAIRKKALAKQRGNTGNKKDD